MIFLFRQMIRIPTFYRFLDVDMALQAVSACDAIIVPGFVPDESRRPPSLSRLGTTAAWIRLDAASEI